MYFFNPKIIIERICICVKEYLILINDNNNSLLYHLYSAADLKEIIKVWVKVKRIYKEILFE